MRHLKSFILDLNMRKSDMKKIFSFSTYNFYGTVAFPYVAKKRMKSWQINQYGSVDEVQLGYSRLPIITNPNQVVIKVSAASVNPIDTAMMQGYGATALNTMRQIDNIEFPLILGRDFSGTIISRGQSEKKLSVGSEVWGVVPVHAQGCHAEFVTVNSKMISEKPKNINTAEAASILYTGLTAYSGLRWCAGLNLTNTEGLNTLVLGASGGVGSSAVQILLAGGARVSATCSTDAIPLVQSLGVHEIFDYTDENYDQRLSELGTFDVILDCAGLGVEHAVKMPWKYRNYVSFTTPVLKNVDNLGILRGALNSANDIICSNINSIKKGGLVKWGYFIPSTEGIRFLKHLVDTKKMKPIIQEIFTFEDTPKAYKRVLDGHLRGKVVIDFTKQ